MLIEFGLASPKDSAYQTHQEIVELDENLYRPMLAGPWEGDDARDVLREVIDWWKLQLDEIDAASRP